MVVNYKNDDFKNYERPGRPLEHDPHWEFFNLEARKRMVVGSRELKHVLDKYDDQMWSFILEIWPFFNPLVTHKSFPNSIIFYLENDKYVIESIEKQNAYAIHCDLKYFDWDTITKIKNQLKNIFWSYNLERIKFDSVVASQVMNYIDYRFLIILLKLFVKPWGLVFLNNVVDYGLPMYFSDKRPKSIQETIRSFSEWNYEIVYKEVIDTPNPQYQKNKRLLLVAKNSLNKWYFF